MSLHFTFELFSEAHFDLLDIWMGNLQVRKWFDEANPAQDIKDDLPDDRITQQIVYLNHLPLAYIQIYDIHAFENHPFAFLPQGSCGLDTFIGPEEMLGLGYGTAYLRQCVGNLINQGVPALGIDPHPDNKRAIRVYEKIGFSGKAVKETQWGLARLMTLTSSEFEGLEP